MGEEKIREMKKRISGGDTRITKALGKEGPLMKMIKENQYCWSAEGKVLGCEGEEEAEEGRVAGDEAGELGRHQTTKGLESH